jgi:nucleotide-binding universal stress UspA family protein
MGKTILLGVDALHYAPEAMTLTRELCHRDDKVIVLHVHEFAVGRFGRLLVDCPEGAAEGLVPELARNLRDAGIAAEGEIRETHVGHVARAIVEAADRHDAAIIVLGSRNRTDVPHIPLGSVSHKLLHLARRPVLVVPRHPAAAKDAPAGVRRAAAEPAAG